MTSDTFSTLICKHEKALFRFCVSLTHSRANAKDLFQESVIKAYLKRGKLKEESSFKRWVATIIYHVHLGSYRKRKRRRELMETKGLSSDTFFNQKIVTNQGIEKLKADDIRKLRSKIYPESYGAFLMYTRGYTYQEIARAYNVPTGTVKSRIHATRKKLERLCRALGIAA